MITRGSRFRHRSSRNGTSVVEAALVLPIFLLFVLGLVELGHSMMVSHVLRSACRQAARIGSTEGHTTASVKSRALQVLGSAVNPSHVTVMVKDASSFDSTASPSTTSSALEALPSLELSNAEPRQLFMVRAKVKYKDIAIVPNIPYLGSFLDDVTLQGQAFMRHE
jgi:Flp pilus assembly protein TadG